MNDAVDWEAYKESGTVRITKEVFIETFLRRFAENAQLSSTYKIEFYKINEEPPLVNIRVLSKETSNIYGKEENYTLMNTINAILETDTTVKVNIE